MMLEPMGLAAGPVVPTREWRELYAALDCAVVAAIHPFYTAAVREFAAAGRGVVGSAPVGYEGTAAWLAAIGERCGIGPDKIAAAQNRILPAIRGRAREVAHSGPHHAVGLRRIGAAGGAPTHRERRRRALCGHRLSADPMVGPGPRMARGQGRAAFKYRASLEQDLAALHEFEPDLAIGTTPVVQKAKELAIPALYFTNLISARPLMGAAGAGSLAQVVNAALGNQARFDEMKAFFTASARDIPPASGRRCPRIIRNFASATRRSSPSPRRSAKPRR